MKRFRKRLKRRSVIAKEVRTNPLYRSKVIQVKSRKTSKKITFDEYEGN